jgi:hypothetical protein
MAHSSSAGHTRRTRKTEVPLIFLIVVDYCFLGNSNPP